MLHTWWNFDRVLLSANAVPIKLRIFARSELHFKRFRTISNWAIYAHTIKRGKREIKRIQGWVISEGDERYKRDIVHTFNEWEKHICCTKRDIREERHKRGIVHTFNECIEDRRPCCVSSTVRCVWYVAWSSITWRATSPNKLSAIFSYSKNIQPAS